MKNAKTFQAFRSKLREWTVTAHRKIWDTNFWGRGTTRYVSIRDPDRRNLLKRSKRELGKLISKALTLISHKFRMGHAVVRRSQGLGINTPLLTTLHFGWNKMEEGREFHQRNEMNSLVNWKRQHDMREHNQATFWPKCIA